MIRFRIILIERPENTTKIQFVLSNCFQVTNQNAMWECPGVGPASIARARKQGFDWHSKKIIEFFDLVIPEGARLVVCKKTSISLQQMT